MIKLYAGLFLTLCVSAIVLAGTIHPSNKDSQYIDYAKKYNCVFKLVTEKDGKISSQSSCVCIKPRWIITAAHIFHNKQDHNSYIIVDGKKIILSKVFISKDFDIGRIGHKDIALGMLASEVDKSVNIPILYSNADEVKKIADIAGWGSTGTFDRGSSKNDGNLRAGTNRINYINNDLLVCDVSHNDNGSPLEFLISHGDSGGGLFIDKKLAGVNSLVFAKDGKPNSSWTDESGHTRVSKFIPWINEIIANNE